MSTRGSIHTPCRQPSELVPCQRSFRDYTDMKKKQQRESKTVQSGKKAAEEHPCPVGLPCTHISPHAVQAMAQALPHWPVCLPFQIHSPQSSHPRRPIPADCTSGAPLPRPPFVLNQWQPLAGDSPPPAPSLLGQDFTGLADPKPQRTPTSMALPSFQ